MTTMTPILRKSAKVSKNNGRVVIEHLDEEISLEGKGAALLDRMLPLLDGKHTTEEISKRLEETTARVKGLTDSLKGGANVLAFDSVITQKFLTPAPDTN